MTYRITFFGGFCGVTTLHDTIESAESHIAKLVEMVPRHQGWEITHLGEMVKACKVSRA